MLNILLVVIIAGLLFYALRRAGMGSGKSAVENLAAGAEFLAENKKQDGVKETASGLQYLVLEPGTGEKHPGPRDRVLVHYHGMLLDGSVFDSSVVRNEPIAFGLNQVIRGWTEGLQLMVEGEKTRLFIPADLAYGNQRAGTIPVGSLLIFDIELLKIES